MAAPTFADALRQCRDALAYHQEQTRPIQRTADALATADAALAAADAASQPPADERKAFEAAYAKRWGRTYLGWCDASKRYKWDSTQEAWTVWRDRASLAQPPAAPAVAGEVAMPERDELRAFLDAAGGEGLVLGGVDAGDLFMKLYGPDGASQALARVPLTRKQLADGWHADHATHNSQFSIDWFLAGARFAEEQHGILPAPTEGGA